MRSNRNLSSLYIHVPFCSSKCSYCDFFSLENIDFSLKKAVVNSTINQLKYFSENYNFEDIETVYIGGGTPSSLPLSILEKLIYSISDILPANIKEFSIEINPETVDMELIYFIQDSPLTRLSTGIQSFDNKFLKILGRQSSSEICLKAVEMLKTSNKELNLDIISSIPGQKSSDSINDIKTALSFVPDHISLYNLTIEEKTPIADLVTNKDIDDEVWLDAALFLKNSGFDHYEISNFASNNHKCLHNINYWKMKPYIGCGPAAVSTLIENNKPYRFFNTSDIQQFLEGENKNWNIRKEEIPIPDYLIETLMMGFRLSEGINTHDFINNFSYDIYGIIPETIIKWINKGMLFKSDKNLALTDNGRLFHSSFIIDIMTEVERRKTPLS